jgi:serine/threonine-protein kinase HipA
VRIDDLNLAADQFAQLCKADLHDRAVFGIDAARQPREVARVVDGWEAHFAALGVSPADRELLKASIDRDALRLQRRAYL